MHHQHTDVGKGIKAFEKKFKDKTGNLWKDRASFQQKGLYSMVLLDGNDNVEVTQRFPFIPLQYRLFTPELQWQSRGKWRILEGRKRETLGVQEKAEVKRATKKVKVSKNAPAIKAAAKKKAQSGLEPRVSESTHTHK